MTWGGQKWDELKAVSADTVTVKVGPGVYTLQPAAQKSDLQLTLPFRGLSTVRTDGKVTGVKVEEMAFKMGDKEMRGPGTVDLREDNGAFRVTGVSATTTQ
jgi:precorrin-4 methylase